MSGPFSTLSTSGDPAMLVVTVAHDGERAGCLVGFHSQCSIEPLRYSVWLSKANHTYRVALLAEWLGVHVLTADDHDLAARFGGATGDDTDKFAGLAWHESAHGVPLLDHCTNRFLGRRVTLLDDGGDHVCVVVEPAAVESAGPFEPLRLSGVTDVEPGHAADG
jgi:flavin reductase (DIM6/NTAB) family NADH-FMN oxidoreductase RutF